MRILTAILALLVLALSVRAEPPRRFTFGVISVALREDLTLVQGGARNAEGAVVLNPGDRITAWNDTPLGTRDDFCRALYASKPGEEVRVSFERIDKQSGEKRSLTETIKLADPKVAFANLYAHREKRVRSFDWAKSLPADSPVRARVQREVAEAHLQDAWSALAAAHEREIDLWSCFESTTALELLLRDPLASEAFVRAVTDDLAAQPERPIDAADATALTLTRLADHDVIPGAAWIPEAGLHELDHVLLALDGASRAEKAGLDSSSPTVRDFEFAWQGQPGHEKCVEVVHAIRQQFAWPRAWLAEVNLAATLDRAIAWLTAEHAATNWGARPATPEQGQAAARFTRRPNVGQSAGEDGAFISWDTPWGIVAVGGTGKNRWQNTPGGHYALILDLGGDDDYVDCASTHFARDGRFTADGAFEAGPITSVSVVIDLGGNDRYRSTGKWGVGAGVMGTAIIYDAGGDDTYECAEWGIGAAFGGIGLIIDAAGNDRYLGGRNTIGCAAYGFGGVIDLTGNDVYDAHEFSIGIGQPGGVGFVLDRAGDDRYRCTGRTPSGYGTAGEFSGWGIGCGFGWRGLAAGGTGMVVDLAGNDLYDAGEFGLGCGYFLGVGLVRDYSGDDVYRSSRYGLATAAHCAVGLFMDDAGNDIYRGKTAASMAGVWDIATGFFYEGGGNDIYRSDGLALGASSQNGFGIFCEAAGNDVYQCGDSGLGFGGAAEYAGGRLARNFGLFFDLGGDDSYPRTLKDGMKSWSREHGLFADD